ncbi:MAG: HD domain-containing protein, partial [bacterium]
DFLKAYNIAKEVHKNQFRDEGTPYITHIDGILKILKNELQENSFDTYTIVALHDVLEDSDKYTKEDLAEIFDPYLADFVDVLTKKEGMSIEEYLKQILNYKYNNIVIEIKLADRLHNVRSLKKIIKTKLEKVKKYIKETEDYYLPIALDNHKELYHLIKSELDTLKELIKQ